MSSIKTHPVPARLLDSAQCPTPFVNSLEQYKSMWTESVEQPEKFFGNVCIQNKYEIGKRGKERERERKKKEDLLLMR